MYFNRRRRQGRYQVFEGQQGPPVEMTNQWTSGAGQQSRVYSEWRAWLRGAAWGALPGGWAVREASGGWGAASLTCGSASAVACCSAAGDGVQPVSMGYPQRSQY